MAKKDFYQLSQVSGDLCLDFANTAETGSRSRPQEWLDSYEDLAQWSAYVGILSGPTVVRLQHTAALQLEAAETVFFRALRLRSSIRALFQALACGSEITEEMFVALTEERRIASEWVRLRPSGSGAPFHWHWQGPEDALDQLIWPVVFAADALLLSPHVGHIKKCANHRCDWLFLDTSKNHTRRWCEMAVCGNRAKVRDHHRKKLRRAADG